MFAAPSFFTSPEQKHFLYQGPHVSRISSAFVSINQNIMILTLSCVGHLSNQVYDMLLRDEQILFQRDVSGLISITASLARFDLIILALHKLRDHHFISADFAQEMIGYYPNLLGGVMQPSSTISETIMTDDMNDDIEPVHEAKRQRK